MNRGPLGTTRSATKPGGDEIVVFAAIAELFQRAWPAEYRYREPLAHHAPPKPALCEELQGVSAAPRAVPSWLWVAVDGHVMGNLLNDRLSVEAQSCEVSACQVVSATRLLLIRKVLSGTLRLRAVMMRATWDSDVQMPIMHAAMHFREETTLTSRATSPASESMQIGCAYPENAEDACETWVIPVLWKRRRRRGGAGHTSTCGYGRCLSAGRVFPLPRT